MTEVSYTLSVSSSVSSVSSEETINHPGGSRKRKVTLKSIDPEIMIGKIKFELLERHMETDEDDNFKGSLA